MERYFDNIFERLYSPKEAGLWYKARHYVMDIMSPLDGGDKKRFKHVVFDMVTEETLAVARQIALLAHYPDYNEKTGENRTVITFYGCKAYEINNAQGVRTKLKDYFGNLLDCCLFSYNGGEPENKKYQECRNNNWLPLDIEFHFYADKCDLDKTGVITASEVKLFFDQYTRQSSGIDITRGMLVNMVYTTGVTIDNLPACDNDNVARYDTALKVFCYKLKTEHIKKEWDKVLTKDLGIYNQLSSVFCADCFESRLNSILDTSKKSLGEYLSLDFKTVMEEINKNINALAYCEHNRWNVEKLILGFSPLKGKDLFKLETVFGKARTDKIKDLKKNKKHIDLCSNSDVRRVNPADVKYDYFLMLAMPQILLSTLK